MITDSSTPSAHKRLRALLYYPPIQAAQSILKQDYKDEMNLEEALMLAVKVLTKTMDSTTLSADKRMHPLSFSSSPPVPRTPNFLSSFVSYLR